jgi:hypothetical protein
MHTDRENPGTPVLPVGMAFWLLSGGSGPDRVAWIADQGFQSLSLLINNPDADDINRFAAACAIGYRGPLVVEVCVDILAGRCSSDIHDPAQTAPVLATRDRRQDSIAWSEA